MIQDNVAIHGDTGTASVLTLHQIDRAAEQENKEEDTGFHPFGTDGRMYPRASTPDLLVYASAFENRYEYRIECACNLSGHNGIGVLPLANEDTIVIFAILNALQSITTTNRNTIVRERHGYRTNRDAITSQRKPLVHICVADAELVELGDLLATSSEEVLPFLMTERTRAYKALARQLLRFDCHFLHIEETDSTLVNLSTWAEMTMRRASHTGPVYSPASKLPLTSFQKESVCQ